MVPVPVAEPYHNFLFVLNLPLATQFPLPVCCQTKLKKFGDFCLIYCQILDVVTYRYSELAYTVYRSTSHRYPLCLAYVVYIDCPFRSSKGRHAWSQPGPGTRHESLWYHHGGQFRYTRSSRFGLKIVNFLHTHTRYYFVPAFSVFQCAVTFTVSTRTSTCPPRPALIRPTWPCSARP